MSYSWQEIYKYLVVIKIGRLDLAFKGFVAFFFDVIKWACSSFFFGFLFHFEERFEFFRFLGNRMAVDHSGHPDRVFLF